MDDDWVFESPVVDDVHNSPEPDEAAPASRVAVTLNASTEDRLKAVAARASGFGSHALPALRAFLHGEQFFRRTEWDSARTSYERAVELDSTFALAFWRLGTIRGWQGGIGDSLGAVYSQRAAALNRGLPPRESLLIMSDSLMSAAPDITRQVPDSAGREILRRLFSTTERATALYGTDPEAWVALGEARYHFGNGSGRSDSMMFDAFDQCGRAAR